MELGQPVIRGGVFPILADGFLEFFDGPCRVSLKDAGFSFSEVKNG